jgi:hypothetical protein
MVWWRVEADKWVLKADLEQELYELWIGSLCDEHGFEGTFVSITEDQQSAFHWLCDFELPHAGERLN